MDRPPPRKALGVGTSRSPVAGCHRTGGRAGRTASRRRRGGGTRRRGHGTKPTPAPRFRPAAVFRRNTVRPPYGGGPDADTPGVDHAMPAAVRTVTFRAEARRRTTPFQLCGSWPRSGRGESRSHDCHVVRTLLSGWEPDGERHRPSSSGLGAAADGASRVARLLPLSARVSPGQGPTAHASVPAYPAAGAEADDVTAECATVRVVRTSLSGPEPDGARLRSSLSGSWRRGGRRESRLPECSRCPHVSLRARARRRTPPFQLIR